MLSELIVCVCECVALSHLLLRFLIGSYSELEEFITGPKHRPASALSFYGQSGGLSDGRSHRPSRSHSMSPGGRDRKFGSPFRADVPLSVQGRSPRGLTRERARADARDPRLWGSLDSSSGATRRPRPRSADSMSRSRVDAFSAAGEVERRVRHVALSYR